MTPRFIGLVSLIIGFLVGGEVAGWRLLSELAMACLALLALTFLWSRYSLSGLSVDRSVSPQRVQVGDVLDDTLAIRSRSQIAKIWVEVIDRGEIPGHDASNVVSIGRKSRVTWTTCSVCVKRGSFAIGPVELRSGDPLGVFTRSTRHPALGTVVIYPPVFALPALQAPFADSAGRREVERRTLTATPSVATVRDYVAGDPLSKVAWSITARTGKLMVKEFDLDPTSEIWVVADFSEASFRTPDRALIVDRGARFGFAEAWLESSEDFVAAISASVTRIALDRKRAVGYIGCNAVRRVLQAESSERQYHHVLEELALARSDGKERVADVLLNESRRFNRNRTPVLITASLDSQWITALDVLTVRGVKPIAVVVDPESFSLERENLEAPTTLREQRFPVFVVNFSRGIDAAFSIENRLATLSPDEQTTAALAGL